jgi:hypothetical protein
MRLLPSSVLGRFFVLTFLWLPVWFAFWYHAAGVILMPSVWISQWFLNLVHPGLIENVEGLARELSFVTGFEVEVPGAPAGAMGQIIVNVNALIYTWNLPVLLALLFAADERFFSYGKLAIAYFGLMPLHVWGVSFEVLKTLSLQSGPEVQAELGFSTWQMELIGLGYQFGYLMLPVIGAATLWIAMNRRLVLILLERPRFAAPRNQETDPEDR